MSMLFYFTSCFLNLFLRETWLIILFSIFLKRTSSTCNFIAVDCARVYNTITSKSHNATLKQDWNIQKENVFFLMSFYSILLAKRLKMVSSSCSLSSNGVFKAYQGCKLEHKSVSFKMDNNNLPQVATETIQIQFTSAQLSWIEF